MDEYLKTIIANLAYVHDLYQELLGALSGVPTTKAIKDSIKEFDRNYNEYKKRTIDEPEELVKFAKNVCIYGKITGSNIVNKFNSASKQVLSIGKKLSEISTQTENYIENTAVDFEELSIIDLEEIKLSANDKERSSVNFDRRFTELKRRIKTSEELLKKHVSDGESKISEVERESSKLSKKVSDRLYAAEQEYQSGVKFVKDKQAEIEGILAHVGEQAIANDFIGNSKSEQKYADYLRYGALACLVAIVLLVGFSFWESTQESFNLQTAIYRIALTAFLTLPAAYLARESTRHRQMQNQHLQMSLELKAMIPYLGDLPDDEKNPLKIELAKKIFGNRESGNSQESFPPDMQQMIMELLKKIDTRTVVVDNSANKNKTN